MAVRTSSFGVGVPPSVEQQSRGGRLDIRPIGGFDGSRRYTDLDLPFTPESQNYDIRDSRIQPRSGLSSFSSTLLDTHVIGGLEAFDEDANAIAVIASEKSWAAIDGAAPRWRAFSATTAPSGTSRDFWSTTVIYDDDRGGNIAVFTNDVDLPYYVDLDQNVQSVSQFTNLGGFLSRAKAVQAFDNRLVWANVFDGQERPSRVAWSQRGRPQSYDNIGFEAGFEDLFEMAGEILGLVRHRDILYILGDQEIWIARPRRDTFAFNFAANIRNIGVPIIRTAVSTPIGVVFMAQDRELYAISGSQLQPLGPAGEGRESRIQTKLQDDMKDVFRTFAFYDQTERVYRLFYTDTAGSWPGQMLKYDIADRTFTFHDLGAEVTHGFDFADPGRVTGALTWDEVTGDWDSQTEEWDDFGVEAAAPGTRFPNVFSSNGTNYRFRSDTTQDDGSAIDCRWRSAGLKAGEGPHYNWLSELEIEFESDSASSLTVAVSEDGFVSDFDTYRASVGSSDQSVLHTPVRITGRTPQFEIRSEGGGPEISRIYATVRRGGRF